jgi:hypothetical protein
MLPKLSFISQLVSSGYWSKFILTSVGTHGPGGGGGGGGKHCGTCLLEYIPLWKFGFG